MKQILIFAMLTLGASIFAVEKTPTPLPASDGQVIWAGLDYSRVRMIGPGEFTDSDKIFPGMLDAWNNLVLQERLSLLQKALGKSIVLDIAGVMEANKSAKASQIINTPGTSDTISESHITPEIISTAVRSYKLENKSGVAVVFIVDRLIKLDKKGTGAVYVVSFDVGTRKVLSSERIVAKAAGFGFRNYWFRIIKDAEKALKKIR